MPEVEVEGEKWKDAYSRTLTHLARGRVASTDALRSGLALQSRVAQGIMTKLKAKGILKEGDPSTGHKWRVNPDELSKEMSLVGAEVPAFEEEPVVIQKNHKQIRKHYRKMLEGLLSEKEREYLGDVKILYLSDILDCKPMTGTEEIKALGFMADRKFKAILDHLLNLRLQLRRPLVQKMVIAEAEGGSVPAAKILDEWMGKRAMPKGDLMTPPNPEAEETDTDFVAELEKELKGEQEDL